MTARLGTPVDHDLVARLRGRVVAELSAERRARLDGSGTVLSRDDERVLGRSLVVQALAEHRQQQLAAGIRLPDRSHDEAVVAALHASLFGLGRLQPLIDDPSLSEINLNGHDQVWLIRDDGSKELGAPVASSDEELIEWVRTAATYSGLSSRPWDTSNPKVEFRLPDGSRLVALMAVVDRPVVSIRLKRRPTVTLDRLRELGDFDDRLQGFLEALVDARQNVLVSGETGAAKTTLVRALAARIGPGERIVTVEHFRELGLDELTSAHPDAIALEERLANAEGQGRVTLADLVQTSRRLDPDRLIVGEVIGDEIVALLDAMSQGNDGGITTIHARTARSVPQRVAVYAIRAGLSLQDALLLFSSAVDFVVHMTRHRAPDGTLVRTCPRWWRSSGSTATRS